MNTVITLYDSPEEWYGDTYICCECNAEFMCDDPRFCPCCGVKFDALRIHYPKEYGGRMETRFINDEKEETKEVIMMYEVIISGGPSDGRILGEFYSVADAADMIKAYNQSEHHPDEYLIIKRMEV